MEERKRKTSERQARVMSSNRQIVVVKDKLIIFPLCIFCIKIYSISSRCGFFDFKRVMFL